MRLPKPSRIRSTETTFTTIGTHSRRLGFLRPSFAHKRLPAHLNRSRIPRAARQPREPGTIVRSVSRLRWPVRCCACRPATTRPRSRSLVFSGVVGLSEAAGAQPQRRSEAPRACAAGAAGFHNLNAHLRTRAAPTLRLTRIPLVLTAPCYPLHRARRGGVEADAWTKFRPSHEQNTLGQAARPPRTSRNVGGPRAAALSRASHILPAPTRVPAAPP